MAQNVTINGVDYTGVPGVSIPLSARSGSALFVDTSEDTITAASLAHGVTAHDASGSPVTGAAAISYDTATKTLEIPSFFGEVV